MNEIWPGYPYTSFPVDFTKVFCPGIKVRSDGRVNSSLPRSGQEIDIAKMAELIEEMKKHQAAKDSFRQQYQGTWDQLAKAARDPGEDLLAKKQKFLGLSSFGKSK